MDIQKIIAKFGGQHAMARAMGLRQSHVQYWLRAGKAPPWRVPAIKDAAERAGIKLTKRELT